MKRVAILGKGALAIAACRIVGDMGWNLVAAVPNRQEPEWDELFSVHLAGHLPHVTVMRGGDWRELLGWNLDLAVSATYDQVIGRELIQECPKLINCHLGRLPQYRGVRPANWSLLNGERLHGVTIHEITEQVDEGPILGSVAFSIWPDIDEVRDAWKRANRYAPLLLRDVLERIDCIDAQPQEEEGAHTYFAREDRLLGQRLGWTRTL